MRLRVWVLIAAIGIAVLTGFIGRGTDLDAFYGIAGVAWLVAIVAGIALLPFWARILPEVPPMPGLFTQPVEGQRWCTACGTPAPKHAACTVCGVAPKPPRPPKAPKPPKPAKAPKERRAKAEKQ